MYWISAWCQNVVPCISSVLIQFFIFKNNRFGQILLESIHLIQSAMHQFAKSQHRLLKSTRSTHRAHTDKHTQTQTDTHTENADPSFPLCFSLFDPPPPPATSSFTTCARKSEPKSTRFHPKHLTFRPYLLTTTAPDSHTHPCHLYLFFWHRETTSTSC